MKSPRRTPVLAAATMIAWWWCGGGLPRATAGDALAPLDLGQVQVGGEIGRRIDMTVAKNFLVLDIENNFLAPFRARRTARAISAWAN